jgi:hypothetical protein
MVTGSGKTITAMIGARKLHEQASPLLIVVAAPYVPLIGPWCDEITPFGLKPVDMTAFSDLQRRGRALRQIGRRLRRGVSAAEAIVVSHDTLCSPEFQEALADFECARLLIADEMYNLGRESFITNPPDFSSTDLASRQRRYGNATKKESRFCSTSLALSFFASRWRKRSAAASSSTNISCIQSICRKKR